MSANLTAGSSSRPGGAAPAADRRQLVAGSVGVASGLLFLTMLVWEYSYAGYSYVPQDGADVTTHADLNKVGFVIALVGYAVLALGLARSGAAGERRSGRIFVGAFASGFVLLALADILTLLGIGGQDSDPLYAVGGLLQILGALAVGITVARAAVWRGWQRWWPLALAVYSLGALFGPLFAGVEPDFPREALGALTYVVLGLALLAHGGRPRQSTTAMGR